MSTDELKKTPGANGFIRTLSILAAAALLFPHKADAELQA